MNIQTTTEYEEFGTQGGRIWINLDVDGAKHRIPHVFGPRDEVLAYFEGRLVIGPNTRTRMSPYHFPVTQVGQEGRAYYGGTPFVPYDPSMA